MQNDQGSAVCSSGATVSKANGVGEQAQACGVYTVVCKGSDGKVRWSDQYANLVTTAGKNDILDKYLSGSGYTGVFYIGLISSTGYAGIAATDTMAAHAGWAEAGVANAPTYSQAARPTAAWAAAAAGVKAFNAPRSFSITSAGTIKGSFLTTAATKDGVTGVLVSAGLFTQGDRLVAPGDTVDVSYSLGV